jgi:serine/threonine-protein kinase RsbW
MGKPPSERKLVIRSVLDEVPRIQKLILEEADARGYSEKATFAIRLALDEALCNAIQHGNGLDPEKSVTVDYSVDDQRVRVVVCDEGPGFKPEDVPDPTNNENLCLPHGRGVMLMRAYMTEVHFNEKGNCVHLVKARDCPRPADRG